MERKVLNYASTSKNTQNIVEADGFQLKGGEIIGMSSDSREVKVISYASTTKHTKNIIEADGFSIKGLGMIGDIASATTVSKHPYVSKQRIKGDMSEAQKQGIELWNSLISKLVEARLMEDKE